MIRWENEVSYEETKYVRSQKKGLEELREDLASAEYRLKHYQESQERTIIQMTTDIQDMKKTAKTKEEKSNLKSRIRSFMIYKKNGIQDIQKIEKKIRSLKEQIRLAEENKNPSHKGLRHKTKRRSNEQIREIVLQYIQEKQPDYLMKENISRLFEVKESQIEQVFHQLNLEGVLHQPVHHAPHDSQRDPWGFVGQMGWMGDLYYIRKDEKEED